MRGNGVAGIRKRGGILPWLLGVFGVTWGVCLAVRHVAPEGGVWGLLLWLFPTVWSPTFFALVLMRATGGTRGWKDEVRGLLRRSHGAGKWLWLASVVPIAATGVAVLTARSAGQASSFIPVAAMLPMVVVQLLTGAVGEELGWRGFLLPRLHARFGEVRAAWLMAGLWSLWHVAALFVPGMPHRLMPPVTMLVFTALFGFFLAFLFFRTNGSVRPTILAHLSLNIAFGVGGVALSSIVFWQTLAALFGAVALVITLTSARRPHDERPPNLSKVRFPSSSSRKET